MPAIGIAKLDLEDAHPGLQAHGTPFRSGQIPVRVDRDGAGLVGFHAPPVARVEPHAGQWKHVVLLRLEQFDHRNIMPAVVRSGDAFALVKPHARQRLEALGRRHRHHQIAPDEADRVLHTALLMAGIRVAEPRLEPVMRAEQGEQTGPGGRAVGVAVAHAGGVAEHHHPGRHARPLEHLQQSLAHALRGLAGKGDHPAHVRTRERHHQETHDPFHARDHGPGPAEIDLHAARRPLQLGEAVRLHAMLPPPALDPAPHRRIRAREPALRHEPLVHARRGVALLDGHAQIRGRPPVHDGRIPRVDQRPARMPRAKGLGRVIPVVGVPGHGRARYAEFPRYLPVAQALAVELPDTPSDTHRCRHFLSSREPSVWLTGTRESIKEPHDAGVLIPPAPSPPTPSKLNAQGVQEQVPTVNTFIRSHTKYPILDILKG